MRTEEHNIEGCVFHGALLFLLALITRLELSVTEEL
jgi:hypothetical protein